MIFAILLGLLVLAGNLLSFYLGIADVYGLSFTTGLFFIAITLPLRDIVHEQGKRVWAFGASMAAYGILYYVIDDRQWVAAVGFALSWAFLIDGAIYEWMRRFGWLPALLVSDLVTTPLGPLLFYWLYTDDFLMPDGQIVVRYLTALVLCGILTYTRLIDRWMLIPRWTYLSRDRWFKFYDPV